MQNFISILQELSISKARHIAFRMLDNRGICDKECTYFELNQRVQSLAAILQVYCKKGDRILLCCNPSLDYIVGFFACLYAGMIAVPVYPPSRTKQHSNTHRLLLIAKDCRATCILATTHTLPLLQDVFHEHHENLTSHIIQIDKNEDLNLNAHNHIWKPTQIRMQDIAFLQYTSGSTGNPKGVMITHENLIDNSAQIYLNFQHSADSSGVIWLPPYHDMGLVGGILQPIYGGFSTTLMSPSAFIQRPHIWLQAISKYKATTSGGPNFAFEYCVKKITAEQCVNLDLSCWKVAFTGSEPIQKSTLEKFAHMFKAYKFSSKAFYPCYGLAESTLFVTGSKVGSGYKTVSLDRQSFIENTIIKVKNIVKNEMSTLDLIGSGEINNAIILLDKNQKCITKDNCIGEVCVSGKSIAKGYWQNEVSTHETFGLSISKIKYMRTGDLGFYYQNELFITGRIKEMFIVNGRNYYPQDIESIIASVNSLTNEQGALAAFIIDAENNNEQQLIVACEVDLNNNIQKDALSLNDYIDNYFNAAKNALFHTYGLNLHALVCVKPRSLPRTSSGKIRRFLCKKHYLDNILNVYTHTKIAKDNDNDNDKDKNKNNTIIKKPEKLKHDFDNKHIVLWMQENIARITDKQINAVYIDVEFSKLNLDSLQLVELSGLLEDKMKCSIDASIFFEYSTIQALAEYLCNVHTSTQNTSKYILEHADNVNNSDSLDIAIVGMSCRFPAAENLHAFWNLLEKGKCGITEIPAERWNINAFFDANPIKSGKMNTRWGGFIQNVLDFDADFFGMLPKETKYTDPQHRLLLELSYEALQHANITTKSLIGSRTGVFVGISSSDYAQLMHKNGQLTEYTGVGNAHSLAANRISYYYDLHGPSMAIDTACSSSLVALHLACKSLQQEECDLALVGGVNLMLDPALNIVFSQARMMAPDGLCKAFDDSANGYVRSEGCAFLVLRRKNDVQEMHTSQQLHPKIWGIVRGSAINQDGRSNGITAPNVAAQKAVIQQALNCANVQPQDVSYVEAHGTGTHLGDPIEYKALSECYGVEKRKQPLLIGSVKSNIGHVEAAAGLAGVIKVLLAFQHQKWPKHLHFSMLNKNIHTPNPLLKICDNTHYFSAKNAPTPNHAHIAAVSSFGFGGSNAHVILQQPQQDISTQHQTHYQKYASTSVNTLLISAHTQDTLQVMIKRFIHDLKHTSISELSFNLNNYAMCTQLHRDHLSYRLALPINNNHNHSNITQLIDALNTYAQDISNIKHIQRNPKGIVFLFAGQGTLLQQSVHAWYQHAPIFKETIDACAHILDNLNFEISLLDCLFNEINKNEEITACLKQTRYMQPVLFALQVALAKQWQYWGVQPAAVVGHSLGEYAAAYIAGIFSIEDALGLLLVRAECMQFTSGKGAMLVVHADIHSLPKHLDGLEIAAFNAPQQIVLCGTHAQVNTYILKLNAHQIKHTLLPVNTAFHSCLLDDVLPKFAEKAKQITYNYPQIPFISTLLGRQLLLNAQDSINANYWTQQMRKPVQFQQAIEASLNEGYTCFLEIGTEDTLINLTERIATKNSAILNLDTGLNAINTWQSLKRNTEIWQHITHTLAHLHCYGYTINWHNVHNNAIAQYVNLPTMAFNRKRFYFDALNDINDINDNNTNTIIKDTVEKVGHEAINNFTNILINTSKNMNINTHLQQDLLDLLAKLLELPVSSIDIDEPFLEMGADSLVLLAAINEIEDKYHVHLTISQLFEELPNIRKLLNFIELHAPQKITKTEESQSMQPSTIQNTAHNHTQNQLNLDISSTQKTYNNKTELVDLFATQLAVMNQQLVILNQHNSQTISTPSNSTSQIINGDDIKCIHTKEDIKNTFSWGKTDGLQIKEALPAWAKPPVLNKNNHENIASENYLNNFMQKYSTQTRKSKELTQQYRAVLADNRASAGFRLSSKEIVYPIVGKKAKGSKIWDIDDNEYTDFTMGFGANLFGHSPSFIVDSMKAQIDEGIQIGPQCEIAGVVAQKISTLTQQERVAFCNSGSEAVMTAIRLARSVTGRTKIAIFSGSYHGTFDGVLARARVLNGELTTVAMINGTPLNFLEQEVLVLEYGQPASLDILQKHTHQLAAILVEPVQSRHPDLQPKEFLVSLRTLTQTHNIAFIWDEVIFGFRAHLGGSQAFFGIQADIATYGKIIGGGMPIGVIAGKATYLNAIDGGFWQYGDDSYPKTEPTFFAGTFNKHPLTMCASLAVLNQLEAHGAELIDDLNHKTHMLASELNTYFTQEDYPIRIVYFTSLFRFNFSGNLDVLFQLLLNKGIYIWEGRNCFLSTAHTAQDIQALINAIKESLLELRNAGILPRSTKNILKNDRNSDICIPFNASQQRFAKWIAASLEHALIGHIPLALKLNNTHTTNTAHMCMPLNLDILQKSIDMIIQRHVILRMAMNIDNCTQNMAQSITLIPDFIDVSYFEHNLEQQQTHIQTYMHDVYIKPFDLNSAPLWRVSVIQTSEHNYILFMVFHHIICDGMAIVNILNDLNEIYTVYLENNNNSAFNALNILPILPKADNPFSLYAAKLNQNTHTHTHTHTHTKININTLEQYSSKGERLYIICDPSLNLYSKIKTFCKKTKSTPFMLMLSAFSIAFSELQQTIGATDNISTINNNIAISSIGRDIKPNDRMVGNFVKLFNISSNHMQPDIHFSSVLADIKKQLINIFSQDTNHNNDNSKLNNIDNISATFNVEPAFNMLNFANFNVEMMPTTITQVEFNVMMNVFYEPQQMCIQLDYRHAYLSKEQAYAFLHTYQNLLTYIVNCKDEDFLLHVLKQINASIVIDA
jgi:acyl transferase domain-containing protein/acyl-CoA synthetase (AMP-forming)/AMP-acid ligase II